MQQSSMQSQQEAGNDIKREILDSSQEKCHVASIYVDSETAFGLLHTGMETSLQKRY